jgi:hypothetical protein
MMATALSIELRVRPTVHRHRVFSEPPGPRAPRGESITQLCETCERPFTMAASVARAGRRFCSRRCAALAARAPRPDADFEVEDACPGCPECAGFAPPFYLQPRAGAHGSRPVEPVPPRCWCSACAARPVAVKGPYRGRCARCRARVWVPDYSGPRTLAIPLHPRQRRAWLEEAA